MAGTGRIGNALRTIGQGFLLGLGFAMAFGIGALVIAFGVQHQFGDTRDPPHVPGEVRDTTFKDLELSGLEENKDEARDYIIGSIKNNGSMARSSVTVRANLFKAGKFVDQHTIEIPESLSPGKSVYFKIECGCKKSPAAEHDTFQVDVISAY